jgi:hypothetical protein
MVKNIRKLFPSSLYLEIDCTKDTEAEAIALEQLG